MAKETLEGLSIEMLKKKKKNSSILIGVMIGIILADLVMLGISITKGEKLNYTVIVIGLLLVYFIIVMFSGIKEINEELGRRSDK